jgi:biotin carboxyl carrier protein
MAEKTLIARVRADEKIPETFIVTSPVVGMADGAPKANVFLNRFDQIVSVKILGQRYVLRLPRDRQGRITEVFIPNEYTPVAFDQPLLRLDPRVSEATGDQAGGAGGQAATEGDDAEGHLITVPAPSEGIFYRRPAPDAPSFVEVGSEVHTGTVLGLVEVMKCFNQITYGGVGLPEKGKVAKILVDDAQEVQFDEVLFLVEPVG